MRTEYENSEIGSLKQALELVFANEVTEAKEKAITELMSKTPDMLTAVRYASRARTFQSIFGLLEIQTKQK